MSIYKDFSIYEKMAEIGFWLESPRIYEYEHGIAMIQAPYHWSIFPNSRIVGIASSIIYPDAAWDYVLGIGHEWFRISDDMRNNKVGQITLEKTPDRILLETGRFFGDLFRPVADGCRTKEDAVRMVRDATDIFLVHLASGYHRHGEIESFPSGEELRGVLEKEITGLM